MNKYNIHFECKQKFGSVTIEAESPEEAKVKAPEIIKNGAWCEKRCENCGLKIKLK